MQGRPFQPRDSSYYNQRRGNNQNSKHRRNDRIRVLQVRLIGSDGQQIGIVNTSDALTMAKREGLDLVEISPTAKPPVCRILDYGKFLYEEEKREKANKKTKVQKLKEVKFRVGIDSHDYQTKIRHAEMFLYNGNKVKLTLAFRGREMERTDLGFEVVRKAIADLAHMGTADMAPKLSGKSISITFSPVIESKRKLKYSTERTEIEEEEDDEDDEE